MPSIEPFLLDPANRAFLGAKPSRQRAVLRTRLGLAFLVGILSLCIVVVGWAALEWFRWLMLQRDYAIVPAQVVKCRKNDKTDGSPNYYVTYRFETTTATGPASYTREQSVGWNTYARLHPGQTVSVRCNNSFPSISSIAEDTSFRNGISVGALMWLPVAFFLCWQVWYCHRDIRLGRKGQVLEGRLLDCTGTIDNENNLKLDLQYRFTSPGGRVIRARQTGYRHDLKDFSLPDPDRPVAVLYLDEKTYKVL